MQFNSYPFIHVIKISSSKQDNKNIRLQYEECLVFVVQAKIAFFFFFINKTKTLGVLSRERRHPRLVHFISSMREHLQHFCCYFFDTISFFETREEKRNNIERFSRQISKEHFNRKQKSCRNRSTSSSQ